MELPRNHHGGGAEKGTCAASSAAAVGDLAPWGRSRVECGGASTARARLQVKYRGIRAQVGPRAKCLGLVVGSGASFFFKEAQPLI